MILLDTCALIEMSNPRSTLSKATSELIKQGCTILSISFAEIACKITANKLHLGLSLEALLERVRETESLQIIDINSEMWLNAISFSWENNGKPHKDPADRLILSYAAAHRLPLVTSDQAMQTRYDHCLW